METVLGSSRVVSTTTCNVAEGFGRLMMVSSSEVSQWRQPLRASATVWCRRERCSTRAVEPGLLPPVGRSGPRRPSGVARVRGWGVTWYQDEFSFDLIGPHDVLSDP